ncbi:MAG TPA: PAS domain-containing protein [Xanthobacteraceae bacterium]|jgi:PAS domain S-box-containing protein|nr:PAS domain-containing protein [Xanthobacteraceae bacterium]
MSKPVPLWWSKPPLIFRYGIAVASVAAALTAGLLLDAFLKTDPFVSLFLCAIMFVAWIGGFGPGLFAAALAILTFDYFFVSSIGSLIVEPKDMLRIVLFGLTAFFVISLVTAQKNAAESLRRARDDLQTSVEDLERLNKMLEAENAERKRAEQKIRQAERDLQVTIDTIPALAGSYQRDGSPDFVNQAWRDYTGLSLADLKGRWEKVIHPDDVALVESERRAHLATGKPFQMEQRLRRADGEYRWHLLSRVPVRDENGNVVKWYAAGYDIEDRKRAEDTLRRRTAQLADAQRLSRTGSVSFRVAAGEIVWSEEAARIFGNAWDIKPSVELVLQRVHPDDVALVQQEIDRARQGGQEFDVEHRLMMPDGTIKHVHVLAHLVKDESGSDEIVGALMDITATKQAQDALSRAQAELAHVTRVTALGELAASIAHEVNQPLAAIVVDGAAGLRWLDQQPPVLDEARSSMESMISDAKRAGEVIHRIRTLSKKTNPEMTQIDVNDVIEEAAALVRHEARSHRVAMRLQLAPGLPSIRGDRIQLQQVIINLAINGVQAMAMVADRTRELLIRTHELESDRVLVAVKDVGVGIEPENLNRLFSAFYTTKPGGLGMGLSICRSIIEAHAGQLSASRNVGPGMTFQFTLPSHKQDG